MIIKTLAGQRFPTELPGLLVTFILVNTTFWTLGTMFTVLLMVGTEREWEPGSLVDKRLAYSSSGPGSIPARGEIF